MNKALSQILIICLMSYSVKPFVNGVYITLGDWFADKTKEVHYRVGFQIKDFEGNKKNISNLKVVVANGNNTQEFKGPTIRHYKNKDDVNIRIKSKVYEDKPADMDKTYGFFDLIGLHSLSNFKYQIVIEETINGEVKNNILKGPFTFESNVADPNKTLKIYTYGDQAYNNNSAFEYISQKEADLILISGDYAYDIHSNLAENAANAEKFDNYFDQGEYLFTRVPLILINGNHEAFDNFALVNTRFIYPLTHGPDINFQKTYRKINEFDANKKARLEVQDELNKQKTNKAAVDQEREAEKKFNNKNVEAHHTPDDFYFILGSTLFYHINLDRIVPDKFYFEVAYKRMARVLESFKDSTEIKNRIYISHRPHYCTNIQSNQNDSANCLATLMMAKPFDDLLLKYKFDMMIDSHVHYYERTKKIANYQEDEGGIIYVTVGTGGGVETEKDRVLLPVNYNVLSLDNITKDPRYNDYKAFVENEKKAQNSNAGALKEEYDDDQNVTGITELLVGPKGISGSMTTYKVNVVLSNKEKKIIGSAKIAYVLGVFDQYVVKTIGNVARLII